VTKSQITRRRFVAGSLAAGAGAAVPATAQAASKHRRGTQGSKPSTANRRADVVVVGAGLAGLTTARELVKAGRSAIVVEARDRVGGRCLSQPLGRGASDVANMGATFVGPTQTRILALMSELGIGKFPTYATGKLLWYEKGKGTPYTGVIPPSSDLSAVIQLGTVTLPAIDSMAKTVPLDAPYDAPNALEWDGMTVETWAKQNISSSAGRDLFALAVEGILSVEPRDVSLLYFLFYVHSAGNTNALIANAGSGGAQDFRVSGGTQRISIAIAQRLGGQRVLLGHPVRRIVQNAGGVTVYADGVTVKAREAVVAVPPTLAGRIDYSPALPGLRDQLTQRTPMGSVIKTIAVYDTPFWRDHGLNGQVTADQGPVKVCFDASPATGRPGVMLGFVDGEDSRILSSRPLSERRRQVLADYARYFGSKALAPRKYIDLTWDNEVWTRGCPVCVMPPGVMTSYGRALRAPVGRIHWAGTETAPVWNGYMDGAVRSGERAAREVLARL
jgi:monoamine oxidase